MRNHEPLLEGGSINFSVELRVLRELGERLVKTPEVALVELVKNAFDADAQLCTITVSPDEIIITDDGSGISLQDFRSRWMRIGTGSRASAARSVRYGRGYTGEKGIGRFAVRFLGDQLLVSSVAIDSSGARTRLEARFDWAAFDGSAEIGSATVPFSVYRAADDAELGTTLRICNLRSAAREVKWSAVSGAVLGVTSPFASLLAVSELPQLGRSQDDPGFRVRLVGVPDVGGQGDIGPELLKHAVWTAKAKIQKGRVRLTVADRDGKLAMSEQYSLTDTSLGDAQVDLRFFPARGGTFSGLPVDGRLAKSWIRENHGVAVYDRGFRVRPYGEVGDDWLGLSRDVSRKARDPESLIAKRYFPMSSEVKNDTQLNWMLKLPGPSQLVGIVTVESRKQTKNSEPSGLVPAADREGFLNTEAFVVLRDIVRGCVEALAFCDHKAQFEARDAARVAQAAQLKQEARDAIKWVNSNPAIRAQDKRKIIAAIADTAQAAEEVVEAEQERAQALEIMSLMGVVAGLMTHEFGEALEALARAEATVRASAGASKALNATADSLAESLKSLRSYSEYVRTFTEGAKVVPEEPFKAYPRLKRATQLVGALSSGRSTPVALELDRQLDAPMVPVSLYEGIALNLLSNATKAVAMSTSQGPHAISIRAWSARGRHVLEVADTGVGIPEPLRNRVFDPLFTTTDRLTGFIGGGMGLGLTVVRRAAESFGGKAMVVAAPPGFNTCIRVEFPEDHSE